MAFMYLQIAEDVPDVVITCEQELIIYEEEKNAVFTWIFSVESGVCIYNINTVGFFLYFSHKRRKFYASS
jgi:hypothetical protein